jgi:predicted small secreted protein
MLDASPVVILAKPDGTGHGRCYPAKCPRRRMAVGPTHGLPGEEQMKLLTMLLLAASFAVAGCNTMSGFGKDVEKAGDKIDDAATKRK